VKYTRKQKAEIRTYYRYMLVRFRADGSVEGKKGGSWGLLYTPEQAEGHLKARGLL
jgi:hypothetical protein